MRSMESGLDFSVLESEAASMNYKLDDSGTEMAMGACVPIPPLPAELTAAVREIEKLTGKKAVWVMLNRLPPSVVVPVHTDTVTYTPERWHLVIKTNPHAYFWSDPTGQIHLNGGRWWGPIPYRANHQIWNGGTTDRIHFVVDLLENL